MITLEDVLHGTITKGELDQELMRLGLMDSEKRQTMMQSVYLLRHLLEAPYWCEPHEMRSMSPELCVLVGVAGVACKIRQRVKVT